MRCGDGTNENAVDFWMKMMPANRVAANVRTAMVVFLASFPQAYTIRGASCKNKLLDGMLLLSVDGSEDMEVE